jgi:hypothetical protein
MVRGATTKKKAALDIRRRKKKPMICFSTRISELTFMSIKKKLAERGE